jgi:hypothetical protein
LSGEDLGDIEGHLVFHEVVTSPAQLVRHRFERNHVVALDVLSLTEAFDPRMYRMAKLAASTNAQAKYLLPFLVLPLPFFLRA